MRCGWSAVVRTDQEVAMLRNGDWTRQTTVPSSRAQDDDLVMSLVEVTLAQPKQERELYLSSVCAHDSELFKEVRKYERTHSTSTARARSEEHTSELQSLAYLVC